MCPKPFDLDRLIFKYDPCHQTEFITYYVKYHAVIANQTCVSIYFFKFIKILELGCQ